MQILLEHLMFIIEWVCLYFIFGFDNTPGQIAIVLVTVFFSSFINYINYWKRHNNYKKYELRGYLAITPALLYISGAMKKNEAQMLISLVALAILIIMHFLCLYLQSTKDFIIQNRMFKGLPENAIRTNNGQVMTYIIIVSFLILLCAAFFRFDSSFLWLGKQITMGIVYIGLLIFAGFSWIVERILLYANQQVVTHDISYLQEMVNDSGNDRLSAVVYAILTFVLFAALIILIGKRIIDFFRREEEEYYKASQSSGKKDYTEVREAIVAPKRMKDPPPRNKNERIRQRYKQIVRKNYKGEIPVTMTVDDITETVENAAVKGNIDELHDITALYEVARYGK